MKKLRDLIDTNCPMIFAGNWPAEHKKGWRWIMNLEVNDDDSTTMIRDYQIAHGPTNVAIGHPFNKMTMKPAPIVNECGLYVRDVEDLVKEAQRTLENDEAIARWLNKKD